jgi:hypothetical protein
VLPPGVFVKGTSANEARGGKGASVARVAAGVAGGRQAAVIMTVPCVELRTAKQPRTSRSHTQAVEGEGGRGVLENNPFRDGDLQRNSCDVVGQP